MITKRNSKDSLPLNLILAILYCCVFLSRLYEFQESHVMVFQTILSCIMLLYINKKYKKDKLFVEFKKIVLIILIFMSINFVLIGNVIFKMMIDATINMPCLVLLLYYTKLKEWVAIGIYLFVFLYIIYSVFVMGNPFDQVTVNNYNYISYHLMLYSIPFFLYCSYNNKLVNVLVPLSCFILSGLATGRGGILCTGIILFYSICLIFKGKWKEVWIQKIGICLCIVGLVVVGIGEYADYIELSISRFSEHGMESSGRSKGWGLYMLSCLNPFYLILGVPVEDIPYIKNNLLGSLHNSYLTLHARDGIWGIAIIYMMIKGLLYTYKLRFNNLFILLACLMEKGFTDADVGGNMVGGDLYVYLLVLFYLEAKYQYYRTPFPVNSSKQL